MKIQDQEIIRAAVRDRYATVAAGNKGMPQTNRATASGCCAPTRQPSPAEGCGCGCGNTHGSMPDVGYSADDLASAPEGANMGLGCGNPVALGSLAEGEVVVDLGSGGGFDCFLAARRVGDDGRVIGVDMTPEMVAKARRNADSAGAANVEFRLGEIEHLPVADNTADSLISNCVINLAVDKRQVFREAFRVLKPGGRLAVSDIVATQSLPPEIQKDLALVSACVGGAATIDDTRTMLTEAGFEGIRIDETKQSRSAVESCATARNAADYVVSAYIQARKPTSIRSPQNGR